MKEGHYIETGVDNETSDIKRWTYYAKVIDNNGKIRAQIHGLKRTKLNKWIKEFK
jgi:hypothetical protein